MAITFQVRLWSEALTSWRPLTLKAGSTARSGVSEASWRILKVGGFADAQLVIVGATPAGIEQDRRIDFAARETDDITGQQGPWVLLYRGRIREIDTQRRGSRGSVKTTSVNLYGEFERLGKAIANQRAVYSPEKDASSVFKAFVQRWKGDAFSTISVQEGVTGQKLSQYDGKRKRLSDIGRELVEYVGGLAWVGCDVDPDTGEDRVGLMPFGSASAPAHTIEIPDTRNRIGQRRLRVSTTDQATVLYLTGGKEEHGGNRLAPAVQGNTGFETPLLAGDAGGNTVPNPSFEVAFGTGEDENWYGTGSKKSNGGEEQPAFDGNDCFETDNTGEYGKIRFTPQIPFQFGHKFTFDLRAGVEVDTADAAGQATLKWLDNSNAQLGATVTIPVPAATSGEDLKLAVDYQRFYAEDLVLPSGAAKAEIEIQMISGTGGNGHGILWDLVRLYDQEFQVQAGWEVRTPGTSKIIELRWADPDVVWQGAYSVYYNVESSDVDDNDVVFRPQDSARVKIRGGETVKGGFFWRIADGSPTHKVQLTIQEYKSGQRVRETRKYFTVEAPVGDIPFVRFELRHSTLQTSDEVFIRAAVRGDGAGYIDGAYLMSMATPSPEVDKPGNFLEDETFRCVLRATDLWAPGDPLHDQAVALGNIPADASEAAVTNRDQADEYGRAFLKIRVPGVKAPEVEVFGRAIRMWPGEYIRAIGREGKEIFPEPLPVIDVEGSWKSGLLRIAPSITEERPSETRTARKIAKEELRRNGSQGSDSSTGSYSSGASLSGGADGGGSSATDIGPATSTLAGIVRTNEDESDPEVPTMNTYTAGQAAQDARLDALESGDGSYREPIAVINPVTGEPEPLYLDDDFVMTVVP